MRTCSRNRPFLQNFGDLDEEVGKFSFLACGTPSHVDLKHVSQQGLADVQRQSTQENCQHNRPFKVLEKRVQNVALAETISHHGESDISKSVEDDDDGKPHLPRVDIILVEVPVEPANEEVVDSCHDPGRANGVIRSNVRHHGDLGGEAMLEKRKRRNRGVKGPRQSQVRMGWKSSSLQP